MEKHSHLQQSGLDLVYYLPLTLIVFIAVVYAIMAFQKSKGRKWNKWRTFSFFFGMALLFVALHPSAMDWAHEDIRGHMFQHLLLAMFAPIFLVLAAPVTLILTVTSVKFARQITSLMKSRFFTIISHPFTAFVLNIGGMYLLYLTPLYNLSLDNAYLHYLIHLHFLIAGYLFTWSIIGPDPVPNKPQMNIKLIALFLSIGAHSFLSKLMYAHLYPFNSPHNAEQIREGAKMMYYWGDLSELMLIIILFIHWYYKRNKTVRQETATL